MCSSGSSGTSGEKEGQKRPLQQQHHSTTAQPNQKSHRLSMARLRGCCWCWQLAIARAACLSNSQARTLNAVASATHSAGVVGVTLGLLAGYCSLPKLANFRESRLPDSPKPSKTKSPKPKASNQRERIRVQSTKAVLCLHKRHNSQHHENSQHQLANIIANKLIANPILYAIGRVLSIQSNLLDARSTPTQQTADTDTETTHKPIAIGWLFVATLFGGACSVVAQHCKPNGQCWPHLAAFGCADASKPTNPKAQSPEPKAQELILSGPKKLASL